MISKRQPAFLKLTMMNEIHNIVKHFSSNGNTVARGVSSLWMRRLGVILVLILLGFSAQAATIQSTATGGNWNSTSTWVGGVIPDATSDVVIAAGATVTVNVDASARSIVINGRLNVDRGVTLIVDGDITVNGQLDMDSGGAAQTIIVKGNFFNNGSSQLDQATVIVVGNFISPTTSTLQNQGNLVIGGNASGIVNQNGGSQVYTLNPNGTTTGLTTSPAPINTAPTSPASLVNLINTYISGAATPCGLAIDGPKNTTTCSGSNVSFSVYSIAPGGTYSYAWEENQGYGWFPLPNSGIYSGATSPTLSITGATSDMDGYIYRCKITSATCTIGQYSYAATLNFSSATPPTATAGGPDNICQSSGAFSLSGASVGGSATSGAWSIISGGGTLSNTGQTATPSGVTYTPAVNYSGIVTLRLTTNTGQCATATSDRTINVNQLPSVVITNPAAVCAPNTVNLTLASVTSGSTPGLTFTYWTNSFASASLSNPSAVAASGTYYIKGTTASGCYDIKSVTATINPLPTIYNVTGGGLSCPGSGVAVGLDGSQSGVSYKLYRGATLVNTVAGTGSAISLGNQTTAGTYTVTATNTTTGCIQNMSGSATVTNDVTAPVITCPAAPAPLAANASCKAAVPNLVALTTATDNCSSAANITITQNPIAGTLVGLGSTAVTITATDQAGNSSSCTVSVSVTDQTAPLITCPADVNVNVDAGSCSATGVALGSPVASDNCSAVTVTNNAPSSYPVGVTNVTWTAKDAAGNTSTCIQKVTVTDNIKPVITCPLNVTAYVDAGTCTKAGTGVSLGTPATSDNCGVASVTNNAPVTYPLGNTTVTWTVTDIHGNVSTCNQTVTIVDNIPPTALCKGAVTVNLDAAGVANITPSLLNNGSYDNCTAAASLMFSVDKPTLGCSAVGTPQTVTLTVRDLTGNTASCSSNVTVKDVLAPVAVSKDFTLVLNGATGTGTLNASDVDNGSSDNCSIVSRTVSPNTFSCADIGDHTVTLTVKDAAGNTSTSTSTVTVKSDLTVDPQLMKNCLLGSGIGSAFYSNASGGNGTYTYNWSSNISTPFCSLWFIVPIDNSQTSTQQNPSYYPWTANGLYTITLTVTDGKGCHTTGSFTFNKTGPEPPDQTSNKSETVCNGSTVQYSASSIANATYQWTVTNGTLLTSATANPISVRWDKGAASGTVRADIVYPGTLGGSCTSQENTAVTISSVSNPSFTSAAITPVCPGTTATYAINANTYTTRNWTITNGTITSGGGTADNSVSVKWGSAASGTVAVSGENNIGCPSSQISQTINIVDNTPPTITCPANVSVNTGVSSCDATGIALGTPTISDNCGSSLVTVTNNAPSSYPVGITTVTWTAKDMKLNTATCTQTVTLTDNVAPVVHTKNITVNLVLSSVSITASDVNNSSTDNCGISTMTVSPNTFTSANVGANTVVLTVTDIHGNSASANATVTVVNNQPAVSIASSDVDNKVCQGTTVTFTATPVNQGSSPSYQWKVNGSNVGTNSLTYSYVPVNNDVVQCIMTVPSPSATVPSNSLTMTVNALPSVNATNSGAVCEGGIISLTGGPNGYINYHWTGPNGYANTMQSPVLSSNATTGLSGTYTLTVTDGNGCVNSANTVVTINALPSAPVITGSSSVCAGANILLSTTATGTITWISSDPGKATISGTGLVTGVSEGSTNITYTVNNGTCSATSSSYLVTVNPLPVTGPVYRQPNN